MADSWSRLVTTWCRNRNWTRCSRWNTAYARREHIQLETRSVCALLQTGSRFCSLTMISWMIQQAISTTTRVAPPKPRRSCFPYSATRTIFSRHHAYQWPQLFLGMFDKPIPFKFAAACKSLADVDCLDSMWTRFRASSSPILQKRFIDSVIGYAMAATKQTGIREGRKCPSVEEYIALRRETGAVKVIQDTALNPGFLSD